MPESPDFSRHNHKANHIHYGTEVYNMVCQFPFPENQSPVAPSACSSRMPTLAMQGTALPLSAVSHLMSFDGSTDNCKLYPHR